jgi:hypothetical protein
MSVKELLEREAFSGDIDELNEHVHDPGDPDGVVEAEREGRPHWTGVAKPVSRKRRLLWSALAIVLVAGIAYGAYWYGTQQAHKSVTKQEAHTQVKSTPTVVPTKHYDSTNFSMGFDYPGNWKIADSSSALTVTSPTAQLQTSSGKAAGRVIVTIENQQSSIPNFPANGAVASIASDMVTYKQPSEVQRAQTYLSYLGYQNATSLDALYITGDSGYQAGQQVPMTDITKGNPLVGVTFETCGDSSCSPGTTGPLSLQASSWKSSVYSTQIANLLESIVVH